MSGGDDRRGRGHRGLTTWLLVLSAAFAVLAIGAPLWGHGVFAATDMINGSPHTILLHDTVDFALPQQDLFAAALRHGHWLDWNPFIGAGVPLGGMTNA